MFRGDKFAALKVEARAGDVLTQIPFWTNPSIFIYSVGSSRMEREVEEWRGGGAEERRREERKGKNEWITRIRERRLISEKSSDEYPKMLNREPVNAMWDKFDYCKEINI